MHSARVICFLRTIPQTFLLWILFLFITEYVELQCSGGCSKDFKITVKCGCIDGP